MKVKKSMDCAPVKDVESTNPYSSWVFGTSEACDFFGVSSQTLSSWEKKGAPKLGYGKWDIKALMEWKYGGTEEKSAEARKLAAEAKFKEAKAEMAVMDQAVMEGKYIEKAEVDRIWATVGTQLKANMMAWARTMAPELAHLDTRSVEKVLSNAVYDLLEQLSSTSRYQKKKID